MVCYAKLPFAYALAPAQQELLQLTQRWHPHFNTQHYQGGWDVLPLRSPGGSNSIFPDLLQGGDFSDTPLLMQCPALAGLLRQLQCPLQSARLMNLKSGARIKPHRDAELSFEQGLARLHFPLCTNPGVVFQVETQHIPMREGECWYINANLIHQVSNHGATDRIHLVVDCCVNSWLQQLFTRGAPLVSRDDADPKQLALVIQELRLQPGAAAQDLAAELEQKLHSLS